MTDDMFGYPREVLADCARREVAKRRSVYPRLINEGSLTPKRAAREIEMMQAIVGLLSKTATALTDEQIIAMRDEHLPAQGEGFDCIAFARAVLNA